MSSKLILGGGVAGLIFAYFNPSYTILTPEVGGQMASKFPLGPRFIHSTEDAKKLFEELGLPIKEFTIKVGYHDDKDFCEQTESFRKRYFMKSRGLNHLNFYDKTVMNSNTKEFKALDVDLPKFVDLLYQKVKHKVIIDKAVGIDPQTREVICQGNRFKYDHLVSTVPKNVFMWLIKQPDDGFRVQPITYVLLDEHFFNMEGFDFVYCAGKTKFHRLAKCEAGIVADLVGEHSQEDCHRIFGEYFCDFVTLPNAQLVSSGKEKSFDGVTFFGRYGTWSRKWKTEYCIEQAKKFAETGELDDGTRRETK